LPGRVASSALGRRGIEHDRNAGHARGVGHAPPRGAQIRVEPEGVDHCRQASTQPPSDDLIEHGERISRGSQVMLGLTDCGSQRIAGDDLVRCEVLSRPR
jgi:hypothetical protein